MNIIVVGMGRMGTSLAHKLDRQGYDVCAIDQEPERLEALRESFGGRTVEGIGFDRKVLEAAGIDRASAVIACTSSDETNIVVARISRQTYRVPRVIARLYEISNAETYRRLGIQSISTTEWGVRRVSELLTFNELDDVVELGARRRPGAARGQHRPRDHRRGRGQHRLGLARQRDLHPHPGNGSPARRHHLRSGRVERGGQVPHHARPGRVRRQA